MPDRFRRLNCGEWNKVEDSIYLNPHNVFGIPAWGLFDLEEYANHISRMVKEINNLAIQDIEGLWRYQHCKDSNCPYKFFTYAIKDSPIEIEYLGIFTQENRGWHRYEITYSRKYIVFMECQKEPLEIAHKLDHLRTNWEQVEEFIEASEKLK